MMTNKGNKTEGEEGYSISLPLCLRKEGDVYNYAMARIDNISGNMNKVKLFSYRRDASEAIKKAWTRFKRMVPEEKADLSQTYCDEDYAIFVFATGEFIEWFLIPVER